MPLIWCFSLDFASRVARRVARQAQKRRAVIVGLVELSLEPVAPFSTALALLLAQALECSPMMSSLFGGLTRGQDVSQLGLGSQLFESPIEVNAVVGPF